MAPTQPGYIVKVIVQAVEVGIFSVLDRCLVEGQSLMELISFDRGWDDDVKIADQRPIRRRPCLPRNSRDTALLDTIYSIRTVLSIKTGSPKVQAPRRKGDRHLG